MSDATDYLRSKNFSGFTVESKWKPLMITKADGVYFEDERGTRYLDFSAQPSCVNLGHNNKKVIDAIKAQADKLVYMLSSFGTEMRTELTKKLAEVLPKNLSKYYFGNSGSEANDAAVKMVRMYRRREGRTKILSRYNSYHGWTGVGGQLTGNARRIPVEPTGAYPGIVHIPDPYCYRCPFKLKYPECGVACADYVDYAIKNEGNVGAMILEPVTGASGVVVPPKEYLPKVRKITEENDVLLIADEVLSGWGRTGEWFAVDNWGVQPDILTTAKGMTGGHFPMSLTATNQAVAEYFEENWMPVSGTYNAHPLGIAAANAAIGEYKRQGLIQRAKEMGEYLGKRLKEIESRHPAVGDVRGIGLLWAIELVKDRQLKTPFNTPEDYFTGKPLMITKVARKAMENGVFIYQGVISHLIISPPLIIAREEIDRGIDALEQGLRVADAETAK